jgi:hypothetical protein
MLLGHRSGAIHCWPLTVVRLVFTKTVVRLVLENHCRRRRRRRRPLLRPSPPFDG